MSNASEPLTGPPTRRQFLRTALVGGAGLTLSPHALAQAPAIIPSERLRPVMPSGIQFGDPLADRVMVWSRSDRVARLVVEWSTRSDFSGAVTVEGPLSRAAADHTAKFDLRGLPPDREIFLRVAFADPDNRRLRSAPQTGRIRTAPRSRRSIRFAWSADIAGQGYGINPEWGGMRGFEAVRRVQPDFFIHSGDTIYADNPIAATQAVPDGSSWQNLVTEETSKVAETLREFHGRFAYNLLDRHVREFAADVPQIWQWDDHEVMNNWSSARNLAADARYTEKNVLTLASRARQAFLDYGPMRLEREGSSERIYRRLPHGPLLDIILLDARSYRGPNTANRQAAPGPETAFLGPAQLAWLKETLRTSTAAWKVIACDMPLGLQIPDGEDAAGRTIYDALANGDGAPLGREFELADLLRFMRQQRIRNTVWITADVHYTAAHYYDPQQAQFTDFDPFWEFVAGPLNAGTFGPSPLDNTFGPQVMFQRVAPFPNAPPSAGYQFFGQVDIDAATSALTVALKDLSGAALFSKTLPPQS